jgi:hypothetical protein
MDLTTLAAALLIALGLLGADTIVHSDTVTLEVVVAPSLTKSDRMSLDQATLELEFEDQLHRIASTPSLVTTPLIRATQDEGVGQAVFAAVRLKHVAETLQTELGYALDRIRLTLYFEQGQVRGLISGDDRRVGSFHQILTMDKDEALVDFVHRCALWSASQLAPYTTALYLLQAHADDGDFAASVALIDHAKAVMPPAPVSLDRSLFDNLLGIIALFKNDPVAARVAFDAATAADPTNLSPVVNAAFTDVQLGDYDKAAERMRHLVTDATPRNRMVLASAYLVWAAAEMGRHELAMADTLLAKAAAADSECSAVFELWAQEKQIAGDDAVGAGLHNQALADTVRFQNIGELAVLYFQPNWRPGAPVARSRFPNPQSVLFH